MPRWDLLISPLHSTEFPHRLQKFLDLPDPQIARDEGRFVARFPGNGELCANSVFWAARMDSMIALSPNALQVSRIGNMSKPVSDWLERHKPSPFKS